MVIVLTSLMVCRQGAKQKVSDYVDRLQTLTDIIEQHNGKLGDIYPESNDTSLQ